MFQWLYNFFKRMRIPEWLRPYVQELNDLMIAMLKTAGKAYVQFLMAQIIAAAKDNSMSPEQKFKYVFGQAKKHFAEFAITLKDNELNTIINYLVSQLKAKGVI